MENHRLEDPSGGSGAPPLRHAGTRAHDLWLEKDSSGYLLYQGRRHSAHTGAEFVSYAPSFVKTAVCLDVGGAAKPQAE